MEIGSIEVVECVELGDPLLLCAHLSDFLGIGECELALHGSIGLVGHVAVVDVGLVVGVDVLHRELVVPILGDPLEVGGEAIAANHDHGEVVAMVLEKESLREVNPGETHFSFKLKN